MILLEGWSDVGVLSAFDGVGDEDKKTFSWHFYRKSSNFTEKIKKTDINERFFLLMSFFFCTFAD